MAAAPLVIVRQPRREITSRHHQHSFRLLSLIKRQARHRQSREPESQKHAPFRLANVPGAFAVLHCAGKGGNRLHHLSLVERTYQIPVQCQDFPNRTNGVASMAPKLPVIGVRRIWSRSNIMNMSKYNVFGIAALVFAAAAWIAPDSDIWL